MPVTTMLEFESYVMLTKAITILAGGFVTLLAYRAYTRTGAPALRALTAGLGLVTTGGFVGGAVHQLANLPIVVAVGIQSTFTALGFIVLAYSLYAEGAGGSGTGSVSGRRSGGTPGP